MTFFEALVPLAGIGMVLLLGLNGIKLAQAKVQARAGGGAETEALRTMVGNMEAEIQRLKDRVAVLEKLATDDDRKLASEIDRLRVAGDALHR